MYVWEHNGCVGNRTGVHGGRVQVRSGLGLARKWQLVHTRQRMLSLFRPLHIWDRSYTGCLLILLTRLSSIWSRMYLTAS